MNVDAEALFALNQCANITGLAGVIAYSNLGVVWKKGAVGFPTAPLLMLDRKCDLYSINRHELFL